jgi:hypothetical protein
VNNGYNRSVSFVFCLLILYGIGGAMMMTGTKWFDGISNSGQGKHLDDDCG